MAFVLAVRNEEADLAATVESIRAQVGGAGPLAIAVGHVGRHVGDHLVHADDVSWRRHLIAEVLAQLGGRSHPFGCQELVLLHVDTLPFR